MSKNKKKENKMSKQIKCYNINYLVEEEDNVIFGSTKEVIIDDDVKLQIDEIIVNAISDETGWLVESFDWKVEEVKQTPTESDNTLEKFMKGDENDEMLVSEHKKLFGN